MSKIKIALGVFITVSVLDIVGIIFKIPQLIYVFKPLILLSLIVLYAVSVSKRDKIYILALLFSFFGDVFLMFEGHFYFISGLISFLLAHLLFISIVVKRLQKTKIPALILSIFPFAIFFFSLIFLLKDSLGEMLLPVIVYGLTIATFGTLALLDYRSKKTYKELFMFLGAIVFMLSDSILAINKFYYSVHLFSVLIMFTYVLAQYFIYKSMVKEE